LKTKEAVLKEMREDGRRIAKMGGAKTTITTIINVKGGNPSAVKGEKTARGAQRWKRGKKTEQKKIARGTCDGKQC